MNNCVCVNYYTMLQNHLSQMINTYMTMQSNTNLPSTDSGIIHSEPQSDPQSSLTDGINLDSLFYLIMIIIALFMLYSVGLRRRLPNKSNIKKN